MKKNIRVILAALSVVVIISSCAVNKVNVTSAPLQSQINFEMSDLEFVKEVEGTAVQSYFVGLPIGGENKYKKINTSQNYWNVVNGKNRGVNNALYNALKDSKDIDFVLPVSMEIESDRMFLGRQDSVIVRLKAFKLKVN